MQLTVKGKQIDVGDALRTHVAESLEAVVQKYISNPTDATVVFSRDAHLFKADIQVRVGRGVVIHCNGDATEPYPAFDAASEKLAKQLRRYKQRLRDHHKQEVDDEDKIVASQYILEAFPDEPEGSDKPLPQPVVIAEMTTDIGVMTVSEAVMRMDLADVQALMFRNSAHNGLNMVYRRADGNIGWIDPINT